MKKITFLLILLMVIFGFLSYTDILSTSCPCYTKLCKGLDCVCVVRNCDLSDKDKVNPSSNGVAWCNP